MSQQLQNLSLDLNTAVKLTESLKEFLQDLRKRFDEYEQIVIDKCDYKQYKDDQRVVRRKRRHNGEIDNAEEQNTLIYHPEKDSGSDPTNPSFIN